MAMQDRLDSHWRDKAENEFRTALHKNPLDQKARSRLIDLLMKQGKIEPAWYTLQDGLSVVAHTRLQTSRTC